MSDDDKALVIALVRQHILTNGDYMTFVPAYRRIRWNSAGPLYWVIEYTGAHLRRKAHCKRSLDCLKCVCKQEDLATPQLHEPVTGRRALNTSRNRRDQRPMHQHHH